MPFPTVVSASTVQTLNGSSWIVDIPAHSTGDLILLVSGFDGNPTVSSISALGGGGGDAWTLALINTANGSANKLYAAWTRATADRAASTVTMTLGSTEQGVTRVWAISGAHITTAPAVGTAVTGTSTTPNPPNLDPAGWATEDTMWFALVNTDAAVTATAYPSNMDTGTGFSDVSGGGNGAGLHTCRLSSAVSALDPGTFTLSGSETWVAQTIAIRPAPPGAVSETVTSTAASTQTSDQQGLAQDIIVNGSSAVQAANESMTESITNSATSTQVADEPPPGTEETIDHSATGSQIALSFDAETSNNIRGPPTHSVLEGSADVILGPGRVTIYESVMEGPPDEPELNVAISTGAMLGGGRDVRSMYISYDGGDTWDETYTQGQNLVGAAGKMVTARMVQACYCYPPNVTETMADDNTDLFIAQLPAYRAGGVLAWSVGLEGGNVFRGTSGDALNIVQTGIDYGINGGDPSFWEEDGLSFKPTYIARLESLIEAANLQGMIVILNLFYGRQGGYLSTQTNYENAIDTLCDWLKLKGYKNICIDIANESGADASGTWPGGHIFTADSTTAAMVEYFIDQWTLETWRPPVGSSSRSKPGPDVLAVSDVHWFHGNVAGSPMPGNRDDWVNDIIADTTTGPVVCNEDEPQTEENGPTAAQFDEEEVAFLAMNDIAGASAGTMIVNAWQRWHSDTTEPFWPEPSGGPTDLSGGTYRQKWKNYTQRWLNLVEGETGGLVIPSG